MKITKRNLTQIFLLTVLASCSSSPKESESYGLPSWVTQPRSECHSNNLCASSSGDSLEKADANALKSLASIFNTKIEATDQLGAYFEQIEGKEDYSENFNSEVMLSVNETLQFSQVVKRYAHQGNFYSLAELDSSASTQVFRTKLNDLEQELNKLLATKLNSAYFRAEQLFKDVLKLNQQLLVVDRSHKANNSKVKRYSSQLKNYYKGKPQKSVSLNESSLPKDLYEALENIFSYHNIVVSSSASEQVITTFESKQEFINVEGFEKWSFNFSLLSKGGDKSGDILISETITARSYTSALLTFKTIMNEKLWDSFYQLKI